MRVVAERLVCIDADAARMTALLDSDLRNLMKMSRKFPANADALVPLSPRGTSGERAGERRISQKGTSSPQPSPPEKEEREELSGSLRNSVRAISNIFG